MTETDILITRVLDAPRERVFQSWTEPERFAHWYGKGDGFETPLDTISMDVRPGGAWRATMKSADMEFPFVGVYHEVRAPERLVFAIRDGNDPDADSGDVVTVSLTDVDGGTEMAFAHVGLAPEVVADTKAGWDSFFDALAEYVAK